MEQKIGVFYETLLFQLKEREKKKREREKGRDRKRN